MQPLYANKPLCDCDPCLNFSLVLLSPKLVFSHLLKLCLNGELVGTFCFGMMTPAGRPALPETFATSFSVADVAAVKFSGPDDDADDEAAAAISGSAGFDPFAPHSICLFLT